MNDLDLLGDEPGTKPRVLVAIPYGWNAFWLPVLLPLAIMSPGILLDPRPLGRQVGILGFIGIVAVFSLYALRGPAFAVAKDGIKLPAKRVAPGRSWRDPWAFGFYSWHEVTFCRWSPYQPGMLSVHMGAVEHQASSWFGLRSPTRVQSPPCISSHPIPEKYREAVEKAIRACGRWAD